MFFFTRYLRIQVCKGRMLLIILLRRIQILFLWQNNSLIFNIHIFVLKLEKLCIECLKGTIFWCVRFWRRKYYNIRNFPHQMCFFPDGMFFIWKLKVVSNILWSLFYQNFVKIVCTDKRQSHTGYTYLSCVVTEDVCLSIFLKTLED